MLAQTLILVSALALSAPAEPAAPKAATRTAPKPAPKAAPKAAPAAAKGPDSAQKLRTGARGKVCLECHGDFEQRLKERLAKLARARGLVD